MDALIFLAYLGMVLLLGILSSIVATKLHVPHVLLLVVLGVVLHHVRYGGGALISFPEIFLTTMGTLALIMILFDSTSKFRLKRFDDYSIGAFKVTFLFMLISIPLFAAATYLVFGAPIGLALVFAALMVGTSPDIALVMMTQGKKHRILEFLHVESILNTPFTVLIPFLILDIVQSASVVDGDVLASLLNHVPAFLLQLVAGIGAGILVALIMFKAMRRQYSETLSPLAIVVAAILAYVLAEWLDGNGVLAVTALGLFFGNVTLKEKETLVVFSSLVKSALEVFVFVLIGLMIDVPLTAGFLLRSLGIFIIFLAVRFLVMQIGLGKTPLADTTMKERIFMATNAPKGIAVAVVVFLLSTIRMEGMDIILDLVFAMIFYSIIFASAASALRSLFSEEFKKAAKSRSNA